MSRIGFERKNNQPPVYFPRLQTANHNSLMTAGQHVLKAQTPQGMLTRDSIQVESKRIPIDEPPRSLSHVNSAGALENEGKPGDLFYIKEFLKEIESIEKINDRSDKYIYQKSQETTSQQAAITDNINKLKDYRPPRPE